MDDTKPAQGIMQTGDWGSAKSFRVACDCHDRDHDVDVCIEVERVDDLPLVSLAFYADLDIRPGNLWQRIKTAVSVLFLGQCRREHELILGQQSAQNLVNAIQNSIDDFKEKRPKNT